MKNSDEAKNLKHKIEGFKGGYARSAAADMAFDFLNSDPDYNKVAQEVWDKLGLEPDKVTWEYADDLQFLLNKAVWDKFVQEFPEKAEKFARENNLQTELRSIQKEKKGALGKKAERRQEEFKKVMEELNILKGKINENAKKVEKAAVDFRNHERESADKEIGDDYFEKIMKKIEDSMNADVNQIEETVAEVKDELDPNTAQEVDSKVEEVRTEKHNTMEKLHNLFKFARKKETLSSQRKSADKRERYEEKIKLSKEEYFNSLQSQWESGLQAIFADLRDRGVEGTIPESYLSGKFEKMLNLIGLSSFPEEVIEITEKAYQQNLQRMRTAAETAVRNYFKRVKAEEEVSAEKNFTKDKTEEPEIFTEEELASEEEFKQEQFIDKEVETAEAEPDFSSFELEKKFSLVNSIQEWQDVLAEAREELAVSGYNFVDIIRTADAIRAGQEVIDALPADFGIRDSFMRICKANEIKYATSVQVVENWRNRTQTGNFEKEASSAVNQTEITGTEKEKNETEDINDNEKVVEKVMENIDLSPAGIEKTLREIVAKTPYALQHLKILLENPANVTKKSDLVTQTIETLLRDYFSKLPLTVEQKKLLETRISAFADRVESSVREKLQNTVDLQAMEKVGMWKSFMSRFSKKNLKDIGRTIGTVATISIAGASIGLGAWTVGAVAGLAKAGLWLHKKYKEKHISEEERQAEQEEIYLKREKLLQQGRAKVLDMHDFDDTKGLDKNKFVMSSEEFAHLLASTVKMESIKNFREGLLIDKQGNIDESVRLALHDRIRDHVEHHPRYAGLTNKERQREVDKLYTIYARQMLNERELLNLTQREVSSENKGKFMKVIEKVQSILGGDVVDFKKKQDVDFKDMGLLFFGAAAIGGSMRLAYRHGAGGYLSALLGSLGGASFGYALARHKEMSRFAKIFQQEVKNLMEESQKDLQGLKDIISGNFPPAEKRKALTRYRNKLNRLEGMLNMSVPSEGGNQPVLRDEALRAEVQAFTFKAREFLLENSAEDVVDTSVAEDEGLTAEQVEIRRKMILDGALRKIEEDLYQEQRKIGHQVAKKMERQAKKNMAIRTAAAVGGAVIGGLIGKYSYEGGRKLGQASRDFYHSIFVDDNAQDGLRAAAGATVGHELTGKGSGIRADSLQHTSFEESSVGGKGFGLEKFAPMLEGARDQKAALNTFKELAFSVEKGDSNAISNHLEQLKNLGIDFKGKEQEFVDSLRQRINFIHETKGKTIEEFAKGDTIKVKSGINFKRGAPPRPSAEEEVARRISSRPPQPTPGHDIKNMNAEEYLKQKMAGGKNLDEPQSMEGPASKEIVTAEHLDYQGAKHVWGEIEKQLSHRSGFKEVFSKWTDGGPERTYAIDYYKDKLVAHPEEYGLKIGKNFDIDHLTKKQLQSIDWDKLFSENNPDKWAPELTEAQKANIIRNNNFLKEWVQKTGKTIESENVNKLLEDINKAGSVENYLASTAETGGGVANWDDIKTAVESAKSFSEVFDKINALDLDPLNMQTDKLYPLIEEKLHNLGFSEDLKINGVSYDGTTGDINRFIGNLDGIEAKFDLGDKITPDSFARLHEAVKGLRSFFAEHPQYKFDVSHIRLDAGDGTVDRVELDLPGSRQDVFLSFSKKGDGFIVSSYQKLFSDGHIPSKVESLLQDLQGKPIDKEGTKALLKELGDEVARLETRARVINVYEHRFNELKNDISADDFYKQRMKIVKELQTYLDRHPEAGDYIKDKTLAAWLVENKDVGNEKYRSAVEHLFADNSSKKDVIGVGKKFVAEEEVASEKLKSGVGKSGQEAVLEKKGTKLTTVDEVFKKKTRVVKEKIELNAMDKKNLTKGLLHDLQDYSSNKNNITEEVLKDFKQKTGLDWDQDKFKFMSKQLTEKLGSGVKPRGNLKKLYDFIYDKNLESVQK